MNHMPTFDQRRAWNAVAAQYQAEVAPDDALVHYGPWAPAETELHLLGEIRSLHILELGCGGGQTAVALAQQGGQVTGLDLSDVHIDLARARAQRADVQVDFVVGDAAELDGFASSAWDLVLATYVMPYITPLAACLAGCYRLLRPGGRLVFSLDHPCRALFFDEEEQEFVLYPVRSYFDERPIHWRFPGAERPMQTQYRTLATWLELIHNAGLHLVRLLEVQTPPALADREWPEGDPLFSMRNVPHTAIFVTQKPAAVGESGVRG
jgi:SAM-dependent methyltransferase